MFSLSAMRRDWVLGVRGLEGEWVDDWCYRLANRPWFRRFLPGFGHLSVMHLTSSSCDFRDQGKSNSNLEMAC